MKLEEKNINPFHSERNFQFHRSLQLRHRDRSCHRIDYYQEGYLQSTGENLPGAHYHNNEYLGSLQGRYPWCSETVDAYFVYPYLQSRSGYEDMEASKNYPWLFDHLELFGEICL